MTVADNAGATGQPDRSLHVAGEGFIAPPLHHRIWGKAVLVHHLTLRSTVGSTLINVMYLTEQTVESAGSGQTLIFSCNTASRAPH